MACDSTNPLLSDSYFYAAWRVPVSQILAIGRRALQHFECRMYPSTKRSLADPDVCGHRMQSASFRVVESTCLSPTPYNCSLLPLTLSPSYSRSPLFDLFLSLKPLSDYPVTRTLGIPRSDERRCASVLDCGYFSSEQSFALKLSS